MRTKTYQNSVGDRLLIAFCYIFIALFSILVLLPFWTVLMDSFSGSVVKSGARMWVDDFSLEAYETVLSQESLFTNYGNTFFRTIVGTVLCVGTTFLAAYPLSKPNMPFCRTITYLMLFTMYFGGGLIPQYLLFRDAGLIDNRLVLILPSMFSAYNILVMRNFISDIPPELEESGKIDGANDVTIAFRIYLPLMKPILATIALWAAVGLWNEWFNAMIYIMTPSKQVMQVMLRRMLMDAQIAAMYDDGIVDITVQEDAVKAVTIIVTILPIICAYPFAQKYFVQGLTSGAVKG